MTNEAIAPWVCLMYHDVAKHLPALSGGPARFAVPSAAFEAQLDAIRAAGLDGCSIADAFARNTGRIGISFDDGDVGQYERAFPALAARGMNATFFITTGWVGRPGYATWAQLREMKAHGMSIQSHTVTHPFLSELDADGLRRELRESKDILDQELAQETDMLALPGGDMPRRHLEHLFEDVGFRVIATSRWGVNRGPSSTRSACYVRRCTVQGQPPRQHFLRVLRGDPWLGARRRSREFVLRSLRRSLGPSRYARWRRRFLDMMADPSTGEPDGFDGHPRTGT